MPHTPEAQVAEPFIGTAQTMHIAPQWAVLATVLRQVPPQLVRPVLHAVPDTHVGCPSPPQGTHIPALGLKPVLQVKPQLPAAQVRTPFMTAGHTLHALPQPSTSVWVLRQVPEQLVRPLPQIMPQLPPAHSSPVPQARPQLPQLEVSLVRLTHTPPQTVCPAGQAQLPLWHVRPPMHTVPQAPQLLLSLPLMIRQVPLQLVWPAGQAQTPA